MAHSESLRVIGQLLEAANIGTFDLETDGPNYIVTCEPLTQNGGWVPHDFSPSDFIAPTTRQPLVPAPVRLRLADIFRLEMQARLRRRQNSFQTEASSTVSQLLRSLGALLEPINLGIFRSAGGSNQMPVDFRRLDGRYDSVPNTLEKLQRLTKSSRLKRSSPKFPTRADRRRDRWRHMLDSARNDEWATNRLQIESV